MSNQEIVSHVKFRELVKSDIRIKELRNKWDYSGVNKRIAELRKEACIPDFRFVSKKYLSRVV